MKITVSIYKYLHWLLSGTNQTNQTTFKQDNNLKQFYNIYEDK